MIYLEIAAVAIVSFYILVQFVQLFSLFNYKNGKDKSTRSQPFISILLAVRNEEENIIECLEGLNNLDYPKDKYQVLIGDDQSTDGTRDICLKYIKEIDNFIYYSVPAKYSPSRGKARVLAYLAKKAIGDYYAITDADIKIPKKWLKGLLSYFESSKKYSNNLKEDKNIGIVSATSVVGNHSTFLGKMQGIDWLYFMGLLKSIDNLKLPSTAIGNNMMIKKEAYWETGGYEKIEFSITEDYKVYEVVTDLGWRCINILTPDTLAIAKPVNDISVLLNQRKRWLKGAKDLQLFWWILFLLFTLFYPAILILFFLNPVFALTYWFFKFFVQNIQISRICAILKYPMFSIKQVIQYELYLIGMTLSTAIYFLAPVKTVWKGREY